MSSRYLFRRRLFSSLATSEDQQGAAYFELVISVVMIVASTLILEVIFDDFWHASLAGLAVGILTFQLQLHNQLRELRGESRDAMEERNRKLMDLLRIHNAYYEDRWLNGVLERIVSLREETQELPHASRQLEQELDTALEVMRKDLKKPRSFELGDDKELQRMTTLRDVIANARKQVLAVTFDSRGYFEKFWETWYTVEYMRANVEAASKGVEIERIFVVGDWVLSGQDEEKSQRLREVVEFLLQGGPKMKVYIADKAKLPQKLASDTSLLVCDGYFASESSGKSDGAVIKGYISYYESQRIHRLTERFDQLRYLAEDARKIFR